MNKDIKKKWVAALRSGKYSQGQFALRNNNGFCCLGVLCDIHRKETGEGSWKENEYKTGKASQLGLLPRPVMKWASLSRNYGIRVKGFTLTAMNDERGSSFSQIADVIEQHA
jgi:hypothetical protein